MKSTGTLPLFALIVSSALVFAHTYPLPTLALTVSGRVSQPLVLCPDDLAAMRQVRAPSGRGAISGVPLKSVLRLAHVEQHGAGTAVLLRSASGRVLLSCDEIMRGRESDFIIECAHSSTPPHTRPRLTRAKARTAQGVQQTGPAPLPRLVMAGGKHSGRRIEQITGIEVLDAGQRPALNDAHRIQIIDHAAQPSLSIIGIGCGDPALITHEAISEMARADCFICADDIQRRFARYLDGRPVLFDPLMARPHYYRTTHPGVPDEEVKRITRETAERNINALRRALDAGKRVAYLEYGDPSLFGSWQSLLPKSARPARLRIVPGISALNAAGAMLGGDIAANGSAIITSPDALTRNDALLKHAAESGDTLVIFLGVKEIRTLSATLRKHYAAATPACVAYRAGYAAGSTIVRTTIDALERDAQRQEEKWLGLIFVGKSVR